MALSTLAKRRLEKVIKLMESLPRSRRFYMGTWFSHSGKEGEHGLTNGAVIEPEHYAACGTSACALGWAASLPYFRKLGIRLTMGDWGIAELSIGRIAGAEVWEHRGIPKFFDLTVSQVGDLFGSWNHDHGPRAWAKRARKLMREWEAE